MKDLEVEEVTLHMSTPVPAAARNLVEAWLQSITALLAARYGELATDALRPLLVSAAAAAVQRRLAKRNQMAAREGAGPFSIQWEPASSTGGWFLPAELEELDEALGRGGTRTYRTPAPDGIRYANRARPVLDDTVSEWW